jgi:hypothetical protein
MNDFDYDAMQKKRIARNASAKKGGSKSKRCTLPSDWLTESQRKKLNGEIMTYQTNKPIMWDEFKRYPTDIQKMYLEHFATVHGCSISMMEAMFGSNRNILYAYINQRPELQGILAKKPDKETKKHFFDWLAVERAQTAKPAESEAETPKEVHEEAPEQKAEETPIFKFNNCVKSGRFVVNGTPNEIGVALLNIFQDKRLAATISFEVIE